MPVWRLGIPTRSPAPPLRSKIVPNELRVELDDADWGQESGVHRNGAFAGCGRTVFPAVRIEAGCLRKLYRIRTDDRQSRVLSGPPSPLAFEIISQKKTGRHVMACRRREWCVLRLAAQNRVGLHRFGRDDSPGLPLGEFRPAPWILLGNSRKQHHKVCVRQHGDVLMRRAVGHNAVCGGRASDDDPYAWRNPRSWGTQRA